MHGRLATTHRSHGQAAAALSHESARRRQRDSHARAVARARLLRAHARGEHYSMQNALSSTPQARIRTKSRTCERCVSYSSTPVVDQLTPID
jgi:regulator of protease activity HflC (stomatin/prohibitin superfamily)